MKYICPLVTVLDIEKSRFFYETLLEQKVKIDHGENVTFHGDFAIHLKAHFSELIDNKVIKSGGNNFEFYFEDDKLEELVHKLEQNNVSFVHKLREQPWRQLVVRVYDPDKNIVEIGESMEYLAFRLSNEGMLEEQISETINMPVDVVRASIQQFRES